MNAAELFVRCLEREGVEYVFGLPGEENLAFLDALSESSIRFISTRHEQGAAFMADVYGRLTGKAGVCSSTLGPGATNLVTGVADAFLDRVPMVAITAQSGMETVHKESHQAIDLLGMFRSVTKWNASIRHPSVVTEVVRKAFKISQAEKPGPCHLELPEDVAGCEAKGEPLVPMKTRRPSPDRPSLQAAAEMIASSGQPIILAGNGVIRGGASEELRKFSKAAGIPVANTFMGKGVVPWEDELSLLSIGLQAHDYVNCGFDRADLVIAVGYDFAEYAPHFWNPQQNKKIIHIDFTAGEVDAAYTPAVEIVADIRETLELLRPLVPPLIQEKKHSAIPQMLRQYILGDLKRLNQDESFPLKPQRVLHDLHSVLGRKDLVISDVGAHKLWIARMYLASEPNTVIISNGFAAMGIAFPGAIAAGLAYPDRHVVAACGDGGFLMNSQEMETAVRLKLHPAVLIFNDNGYGLIRWKQEARFHRAAGVSLGNPDWVKFAESFGAKGYRIEAAADLKKVLQEALRQKVPTVIDVPIDYQEQGHLIEQLGHLVCPL
ncbi:MAG: acetolactate synthase large subunit [Candidatus Omnitrophica bacterium]|nr:acetolactate synthase large subunit [Candidatus Omnitrophota bacterium]